MMTVERQLPRKSRTIAAVSPAASSASKTTPCTAALTNTDWSNSSCSLMSEGSVVSTRGSSAFRLATMSRVDAPPFFSTESSTPRAPSWRTMLVCGTKPSRT